MKRTVVILACLLAACEARGGADDSYVLYRSSPVNAAMRLHVASFDTDQGEAYNRGNCEIARDLFQAQPGVKVKYWCEKGRYRV